MNDRQFESLMFNLGQLQEELREIRIAVEQLREGEQSIKNGVSELKLEERMALEKLAMKEGRELKVRPEVKRMAEEMEKQLQANEHKGGWKDCGLGFLLEELKKNLDVLEDVAYRPYIQGANNPVDFYIRKKCANINNFSMMIADNFGKLMVRKGDG